MFRREKIRLSLLKAVLRSRSRQVFGSIPTGSVADPYHFDTDPDPDPGCEKIRYGSGSRVNFDTNPDPGKNNTDPDPAKRTKYQENL